MVSIDSQIAAYRRLASAERASELITKRLAVGLAITDRGDRANLLGLSRSVRTASASLVAVRNSLEGGTAAVAVASQGTRTAQVDLGNMRALLVAAKDPDANLQTLHSQFAQLAGALRANVAASSFNGVNLLLSSGNRAYAAAPKATDGQIYAIGVNQDRTRLFDTSGSRGILQRTFDLPAISGSAPNTLGLSGTASIGSDAATPPMIGGLGGPSMSTDGLASGAPSTGGLSGTTNTTTTGSSSPPATSGFSGEGQLVVGSAGTSTRSAKATVGTYDASLLPSGDQIHLNVRVNGTSHTITLNDRLMATRDTFLSHLSSQVANAFGNAVVVRIENDNSITLETAASGADQSIEVVSISTTDGNDVTTSELSLTTRNTFANTRKVFDGKSVFFHDMTPPTTAGFDRTDRLGFTVRTRTENGVEASQRIEVALAEVDSTNVASLRSSLVAAMDKAFLAAEPSGLLRAVVDGTSVSVYAADGTTNIFVSTIERLNGDGKSGNTLGLTAGSANGTSVSAAQRASVTTGSDFVGPVIVTGDALLKFDLTVNGSTTAVTISASTVEAALGGTSDYAAGSGRIDTIAQLALVSARGISEANLSGVDVSAKDSRLQFTLTMPPSTGDRIVVSNVRSSATPAQTVLTTGSDFSGPVRIDANDSIDFELTIGGDARSISLTKSDVEAALGNRGGRTQGSGIIADVAELALSVRAALVREGIAGLDVGTAGNRLTFTSEGSRTLGLGQVSASSFASNASAVTGSDFTAPIDVASDSRIRFDLKLDDGHSQRIEITRATVEAVLGAVPGREAGTGRISNISELVSVVRQALIDANVSGILVERSGSRLRFVREEAGAGRVVVSNVENLGYTASGDFLRTGSAFGGPVTLEREARIDFEIAREGNSFALVTIRHETVERALANVAGRQPGSGRIANAAELALVTSEALQNAGVTGINIQAVNERLEFRRADGVGHVALRAVTSTASPGDQIASATSIFSLNLASERMMGADMFSRTALLDAYIVNIDAIRSDVANADAYLARVAGQLDIQSRHTTGLGFLEDRRMKELVKNDFDRDTAAKAALDARLALARSALSIITQSRANILNIFS